MLEYSKALQKAAENLPVKAAKSKAEIVAQYKTKTAPYKNALVGLVKEKGFHIGFEKAEILAIKANLLGISTEITPTAAHLSPKIFQTASAVGQKVAVKIVSAIVTAFINSLNLKSEGLDTIDILEFSMEFCNRYDHESIDDLILCLKEAKASARNFYGHFNIMTLNEIWSEYLSKKYETLSQEHQNQKLVFGNVNTEIHTDIARMEKLEKAIEERENRKVHLEELKYGNKVEAITQKVINSLNINQNPKNDD